MAKPYLGCQRIRIEVMDFDMKTGKFSEAEVYLAVLGAGPARNSLEGKISSYEVWKSIQRNPSAIPVERVK